MKKKFEAIGALIKQYRMMRQLSQRELALALSCSASLINHFEKGNRKPELVDAFRIERILKVEDESISQLVIGHDYREAMGKDWMGSVKHGGGIEGEAAGSVQLETRVISVPVKIPKDIYLKLEFE